MEEYIRIGTTTKTYGYRGELKIVVDEHFLDDLKKASAVFMVVKGKPLPFFVQELSEGANLLLKVEEVDSREAARELTNKELYLRKTDVKKAGDLPKSEEPDLLYLTGFQVVDQDLGPIGEIEEVLELPQQIMAVLNYQGKEVLIPLSNQLIIGWDPVRRQLLMELPAGLLEL